ncbi:MAG TPA: cadherin-like domain-containing protein, partial [Blastocatellia bacterium]
MRSQSARCLFILSAFLFTIVAISIVGGRAFNGANSRSPQAQAHAPAQFSSNKFAGGQRRLGGVKAVSPADPNPFRSAFSFNTASGFNYASLFAPNVTAVKSATLQTDVNGNGFVNPGDTLMYSVLVSNTGMDAMNVIFSDQLDANLTLSGTATASPIVVNESYDTIGNTQLQVAGTQTIASPGVFVNGSVLSNDIDPQGGTLTVTAITNGPTTAGGTVTLNTDGTFIYTPQVGDVNVADTFTYTVNEPDGKTGTGTVTINVANARVWYVRNNATSGGLGRSGDPFDTLAEAQTASAANDTIYVFFGNGTTSNQSLGIALKSGQRLIGEGVALTVPVSVNGGPNPTVLRAAGSQPLLDHTTAGGSAVSATDLIPAEIAGLNLAGSTNAIDWTTTAAFAGSGTLVIHDNTVRAAGSEGVDINLAGTGATGLAFSDNNLTATGTGLDIQETGTGSLTIIAFDDNVVNGNTGGSGIVIANAVFDSVPGGGLNTVLGGTTVIGASGNGVGAAGLVLSNVQGDLHFANLNVFADGGAGISTSGT